MHPFQHRQTSTIFSGYATASGETSANCHDSLVYSLSDSGILSAGSGTVFSTSQGTVYQRFNASANIHDIYATWQVSNQTVMWTNNLYNTLVWNNNLFSNDTASFCVIHGVVRVYFLFQPLPDCVPVNLAILPCMVSSLVERFTMLIDTSVIMQIPASSTESLRQCRTVHEWVEQWFKLSPVPSVLRDVIIFRLSPFLISEHRIYTQYECAYPAFVLVQVQEHLRSSTDNMLYRSTIKHPIRYHYSDCAICINNNLAANTTHASPPLHPKVQTHNSNLSQPKPQIPKSPPSPTCLHPI